jgi:ABC-type glycerol-3-phosphate transport system substrate-binding protein
LNVKTLKKLIDKVRAFCVAHLNVKPLDIFLIIAVIMALVYIFVNRSCEAVNEPRHIKRTNINISSQCVNLFGRDTVDALIQEFEKLNPELQIQEVAADDSADIVFFDDSEFDSLMNASAPASLNFYRPLVSFMDVFIYNIDILKAANLDRPPKTRAEFLTAARAVEAQGAEDPEADEGPVFAFALGLSPADPLALRRDFYPWIWASGVDISSIDLSEDNPALPRTVTDVIAFFGQLNREELLAPGTFEKTGAQRLQEFAEGKIAMMTISARDIAFLLNDTHGITVGITALPAITQGKNRLGLSSLYAGISSAGTVPNEARIFLSFLAEKSDVLAEALGAVPGKFPGDFAGEYIEKNELYSKAWDIFEAADIVEYKPGQPSEEAFNRLVREKLVEVFE